MAPVVRERCCLSCMSTATVDAFPVRGDHATDSGLLIKARSLGMSLCLLAVISAPAETLDQANPDRKALKIAIFFLLVYSTQPLCYQYPPLQANDERPICLLPQSLFLLPAPPAGSVPHLRYITPRRESPCSSLGATESVSRQLSTNARMQARQQHAGLVTSPTLKASKNGSTPATLNPP